jgi:ribitol 2-dehydrogenase
MSSSLEGKTVIVTGASSGIGRATARVLANEGCNLVFAARRKERLDALAAELGPATLAVPTDIVRKEETVRLATLAIERFGQVDALLANAGIFIPGNFAAGNIDDWLKQIAINVEGVMTSIHAVLPGMISRGAGDIIVTSSISGFVDIDGEPVYSASKHAVQSFVHTLRNQLAPSGIRVGTVSPGIVLNEIWGITDEAEIDRRIAERSGIRSEDVADAILYMLSRPEHVTIRDLVILPQNQII